MICKTISHYKIIEKLGSGGMGVVYKAQDLKLDRFVALKFLPPHLTSSEEEKQRFIHEAKAASALQHNNICAIHEIDETDDDQIFICMDYYEGETLKNKIEHGQLRSVDEKLDIAIQIANGLAKAHEKEIVHRDIKPANIMLTTDGVVKILDFGLAKLSTQTKLTKDGTTLGTISYISPEQARGDEVNHRTDIWSLGVIIYEMLTGQLPFKGDYDQAVVYSILNEKPEPLHEDTPIKLVTIIWKCLEKNPSDRYQDVGEVINDLNEFRGRTFSAQTGRINLKKKYKAFLLPAAALLVFVLVIIGYLYIPFGMSEKTEETGAKWENSIAVLPIEDLSVGDSLEWFCDGMTDQLISTLGRLRRLKVIGKKSVMPYKETQKTYSEIGQELNVSYVLESSFRKSGDTMRITARLIKTDEGVQIWSKDYDRMYKEFIKVQDEVSGAIATNLLADLTDLEKTRITTVQNVDLETYQLYLKGRNHWNERIQEGILKAIEYFNQAIVKDSNYAAAYAGLADCYGIQAAYYMVLPKLAYPKAEAAALKALEIDDKLAEAYTSLAGVKLGYWEWSEAESLFKKAISLNPNYPTAHHWYSELLICLGRHEEAIREIKRACELDPLSPIINMKRATVYYFSRDYIQAIKQFKKALELHPNFIHAHINLGFTYTQIDMHEEAIRSIQKGKTLLESPVSDANLGYIYAKAGKNDKALQMLESLLKLSNEKLVQYALEIAILHIGLRENDKAFYWLEIAYDEYDYNLIFIKVDPAFDPIRSDLRFIDLLERMGLDK